MKKWNSRSDYFYIMVEGSYWDLPSYRPLMLTHRKPETKLIVSDTEDDSWGTNYWANNHRTTKQGQAESQTKLYLDMHVELAKPPNLAKRVGLGW